MSEYNSNYEIAQAISERIGTAPVPFDSVYEICLQIYNELGGDPAEFDSVYEILLGILPLVEGGSKKSITEVDALPEAQENKDSIYRLTSDDKVYMSKHVSTEYTNRLPDEQQIDKACIKDTDNEPNYYKGTYKVICSDGEINGYGWYSYDGEYWYMYISDVNAEHITENEAVYTLGDEELTLVLNQENKTITASDYTIAELQADWREVLKDMNLYPIPAIYNAPEADCIGNATLEGNGEKGIYTGEQIIFDDGGHSTTGYKWTDEDDSDYCFVTLKPASEIYFTKVDNDIYTDLGEYPIYYISISTPEDPVLEEQLRFGDLYIPQLNAPDSEQIGKAYSAGENNLTYVGEKQLHCSDGDMTVYYWGTPGNINMSAISKAPAENTYVLDDGSPITDGLFGYALTHASWSDYSTLTYNGTINDFNTYFKDYFNDMYIKNLVKYQRAIENWEWKEIVTKDDLSSYATKTYVDTNLELKADKTYVDTNFAKVVSLTQAQYDALATKDAHTLYIITDAQ